MPNRVEAPWTRKKRGDSAVGVEEEEENWYNFYGLDLVGVLRNPVITDRHLEDLRHPAPRPLSNRYMYLMPAPSSLFGAQDMPSIALILGQYIKDPYLASLLFGMILIVALARSNP
ncbi:hypothetical protein DPEC_G00344460 [Dallia pectoralis]|uniref:Uncharacterized protein n=1 Tax=Dallia pectoralis TaxID=75939 RepID=A0ACC2F344_DALPE|nr:hypothetical protein DPEC_G00344460 [Dallia pectoralis]